MSPLSIPEKLEQARTEQTEIEQKLSDPAVIQSQEYRGLTQRYARLRELVELCEEWEGLQSSIAEEEEMLETEEELRGELEEALAEDHERVAGVEAKIRLLLVPPDPNDEKTAIV